MSSRRVPALKPREVLQALKRAGFLVHHVSGSHHVLKHPDHPALRVTVPYHTHDLKRKTLASIIEQAGLTTDAFMDLL
jgi:predicted RNA binding protein YcfA (HicA-like mRNA interferase family)